MQPPRAVGPPGHVAMAGPHPPSQRLDRCVLCLGSGEGWARSGAEGSVSLASAHGAPRVGRDKDGELR